MPNNINNVALVSAAGAGKTRALTRRFIRLFLDRRSYPLDCLYGITFTNEAAFEMKERIMKYLDLLISGRPIDESDEDILRFFQKTFGDVETLARQRKKYLLDNLSELHVSTFHSLFASFLSSVPFTAGIIPGYRIIDETQENIIFERVLDAFFKEIHEDQALYGIVSAFMEQQETSLKKSLLKLSRNLVPWLNYLEHLITAEKKVNRKLGEESQAFSEQLARLKNFIMAHEECARTKTTGKMNKHLADYLRKLDEYLQSGSEQILHNVVFGVDITQKSYMRIFLERLGAEAATMVGIIAELKERTGKYLIALSDQQILIHLKPIMELYKRFQQEKLRENVISFDDIEQYTLQALQQNAETEYLYFKIGGEIRHLMIDEFQDTTFREIQILEPLISEITSVDPNEKSLFYVGDPFQAIYRWRGGTPELFDLLKRTYEGKIESQELTTNYRTTQEIIDFVNRVLGKHDQVKPGSTGGWVRVEHLGDFSDTAAGREQVRDRVCSIIKELHEAHGYRYSDIAVLIRTNKRGREIAQSFVEQGIPHISTSRAVLIDNQDVRFMLHLLAFLNDPENDFALMHVLLSPIFRIKEETLFRLAGKRKTLFLALSDIHPDWPVTRKLRHLLDMVYFCDPYQLIFRIYLTLGLNLSYALSTLLDCAHSRLIEGYNTLGTFLDWLKQAGASIEIREVHPEGVKILTVHKAKGLEFEVVIIPETHRALSTSENDVLLFSYARGAEPSGLYWRSYGCYFDDLKNSERTRIERDELNTLYVALTRAKRGVHVLGFESHNKHGYWFDVIAERLGTRQYSSGTIAKLEPAAGDDRKGEAFRPPVQMPGVVREERTIYSPTERGIEIMTAPRRERLEFGTIVHDALSMIQWLDDADVEQAIANIVDRTMGIHARTKEHEEKLMVHLKSVLENTLTDADLKFIFFRKGHDVECKNELPIYFEDKKQDVAGVIDRLLIMPENVVIIDYKTGEEKPEYNKQMRLYERGIKKIFGEKSVKTYVVYLEKERGKKLTAL